MANHKTDGCSAEPFRRGQLTEHAHVPRPPLGDAPGIRTKLQGAHGRLLRSPRQPWGLPEHPGKLASGSETGSRRGTGPWSHYHAARPSAILSPSPVGTCTGTGRGPPLRGVICETAQSAGTAMCASVGQAGGDQLASRCGGLSSPVHLTPPSKRPRAPVLPGHVSPNACLIFLPHWTHSAFEFHPWEAS